jgi:hypothetical protein
MQEQTTLPYASKTKGRMHACDHDGHTTMLLGTARYLCDHRECDRALVLILQTAEEAKNVNTLMLTGPMCATDTQGGTSNTSSTLQFVTLPVLSLPWCGLEAFQHGLHLLRPVQINVGQKQSGHRPRLFLSQNRHVFAPRSPP